MTRKWARRTCSRWKDMTPEQESTLIEQAIDAKTLSYAPYSAFRVGAAALLEDGTIVQGANIENASYGMCVKQQLALPNYIGACICAERSAIVRIKQEPRWRHQKIVAMAVNSDTETAPCTPCGICRQVLREFCTPDMPVLFPTKHWQQDAHVLALTLEELLPYSFGPSVLGK